MAGPIDMGEAAALGAVQGATEFLPVSSDGHIALGAFFFGISDMPLAMVVLLHVGTFIATIALFWDDIVALIRATLRGVAKPREFLGTDEGKLVSAMVAATIPTGVIGLLLEPHVEDFAQVPWIVGAGLLGSSVAVLSTLRGGGTSSVLPLGRAFLVGLAQGLAVLPGLSRSGMSIAVAMALGLSGPAAFRFSFLLSLPAIGGAMLLELRHWDQLVTLGPGALVGATMALLVGYLALRWLRALVDQGRFWVFAIYLVPLGLGVIAWGALR